MRIAHSLLTALALSFSTLLSVGCATGGDDDDGLGELDGEIAAPGSFDVYKSSDSQFRFRLRAGNGNILLASEGYSSRTNAIAGVLSVMSNGVDPAQYEVALSKNDKYFLRLRAASNNQVIGFTQLYASKSNAKRAVTSCVRAVTSYLDRVYASTTRDRVEVSTDTDGTFGFAVLTKDGELVASSHRYATEASALNGAMAIQEGAQIATLGKVAQDDKGGFYFRMQASNGAVVATSPSFATAEEAHNKLTAAKALIAKIDVL